MGHELNRKYDAFNTPPQKIDVFNEAGWFWSFLFFFFWFALLLKYHDLDWEKQETTNSVKSYIGVCLKEILC